MYIKKILQNMKYPYPLIEYVASTASRRYKVYQIPKRNKTGKRTIAQPTKLVKLIQQEIISEILSKFPIHECAKAYKKGSNIFENAFPHRNNHFLLKMDFANFFNSITCNDWEIYLNEKKDIIKHFDFDASDITFLQNILFWTPKGTTDKILSIGAPSSPILSNILLWNFDEQLSKYCKEKHVTYTRYADDLSFSCNECNKLKDVETFVKKLCCEISYPQLVINENKTVHTSKKHNRHIAGITITNEGTLSLGYKRKIIIKSLIYKFLNNELDDKNKKYLKGILNFSQSIDRIFMNRMEQKYGKENIQKILSY